MEDSGSGKLPHDESTDYIDEDSSIEPGDGSISNELDENTNDLEAAIESEDHKESFTTDATEVGSFFIF